ncbi:hypothetical protein [Candidatus Chloroploca asiatica]|nr:hypothetical protein [Candidatus Chloroploca asiatica]
MCHELDTRHEEADELIGLFQERVACFKVTVVAQLEPGEPGVSLL